MPYVITGTRTKDEHCIETCPANCIHPTKDEPDFATAAQLYVNPTECIDRVVLATRSARLPRFSIWRNCQRNCRNLFKRKPLTLTKRCLTRPKAHRPPSRGELSFLECGSSPLLRNDPAKRPDGVCAKSSLPGRARVLRRRNHNSLSTRAKRGICFSQNAKEKEDSSPRRFRLE